MRRNRVPSRWMALLPAAFLQCLTLTLWAVPSLHGQAPAPERRVFPVSVLDKDGKPVVGLTAANFRGEFRKQPVKIVSVSPDYSNRRIAVALDVSNSMRFRPNWKIAWSVALDVAERFTPTHAVGLYTFDQEAFAHGGLLRDGAELRKKVLEANKEEAREGGGTAFYYALAAIASQFSPAQFGDAILVVGDGNDTMSSSRKNRTLDLLARTGVRVFLVCIPPNGEYPNRQRHTLRDCQTVANPTGGVAFPPENMLPPSAEEMVRRVRAYYPAMFQVYRLGVEFSQRIDKRREWKLEVVGDDGKEMKDVQVAYPRLLVPLKEKM